VCVRALVDINKQQNTRYAHKRNRFPAPVFCTRQFTLGFCGEFIT